jgi:hypothetical protein
VQEGLWIEIIDSMVHEFVGSVESLGLGLLTQCNLFGWGFFFFFFFLYFFFQLTRLGEGSSVQTPAIDSKGRLEK